MSMAKDEDIPFNYQRETKASRSSRILPEYYSPRKTRIKQKETAKELESNFEYLLSVGRDIRKRAREETLTHRAAERVRNN